MSRPVQSNHCRRSDDWSRSPTSKVLPDGVVRLRFSDSTERIVDLAPFLWGPAFEGLAEDDDLFAEVKVDSKTSTIAWPNGADLDPDVLHGDFEPAKPAGRGQSPGVREGPPLTRGQTVEPSTEAARACI